MNKSKFKIGDRLLLKLNSGQGFEGDLVKYTANRLDLTNLICHETGNVLDSVYSFYQCEISSVLLLNAKKDPKQTQNGETQTCQRKSDAVLLNRDEYERLKEVVKNYVYIKKDDKSYFDAVKDLINFESLGVFAKGSEKGRNGCIELIAIATWKKVYVFDLKLMNLRMFPPEITELFECSYITKVVHAGGTLKDCLEHVHNVFLTNVFDTQVADLMISKCASGKCPEKLRNISVCLGVHLNFPSTLLDPALESLSESWDARPLDEQQILRMSKMVGYLITLKDHFQNRMLRDFYSAVNNYHDLFSKSSLYKMESIRSSTKCTEEIEKMIPTSLNINESN